MIGGKLGLHQSCHLCLSEDFPVLSVLSGILTLSLEGLPLVSLETVGIWNISNGIDDTAK